MNINKDAWSLQFIFDESLKVMDQLQQMYDTIMQDTQEDNEKFFALKIIKHALLNAMMYRRFLENTVKECESMIVMRFAKPEPREIHLRNEMSIRFFLLFFFGRKEGRVSFPHKGLDEINERVDIKGRGAVTRRVCLAGKRQGLDKAGKRR